MRPREPIGSEASTGAAARFAIVSPIRVGLAVVLLSSFALGALAAASPSSPALPQEPVAAPPLPPGGSAQSSVPVSFLIETIKVEGVRGSSAKIVVSETLLTLGSAYTEAQLREALHRVERLPFVVEADFALRRGSERGRFQLVISVKETWPIFVGGSLVLARSDSRYKPSDEAVVLPELGGRVFFGGYNELSATLRGVRFITRDGGDADPLVCDATYRHHNLFGRHVVGSAFYRDQGSGSSEGGAEIAWPLSRASALKVNFTQSRSRWKPCAEPCSLEESRSTNNTFGLSWDRDTTDDPFAPRQGSRVGSTFSYSDDRGHTASDYDPWNPGSYSVPPETRRPVWINESDGGNVDLSLSGRRYWPVLRRASLGLGATVTVGRGSGDSVYTQGETVRTIGQSGSKAQGTLEAELVGVPGRLGRGGTQIWWVVRASAWGTAYRVDYDANPPLGFSRAEIEFSHARVSAGLAFRGRWGLARLELQYTYNFLGSAEYR
jgi:hypothetical protein